MTKSSLIIALTSALCATCVLSLDYSEIEGLGVSCPNRDTCTANINRTVYTASCECDAKCSHYRDCCIDAQVSRRHPSPGSLEPYRHMTCLSLTKEEGVYVISKCKSSWRNGEDIRRQCEDLSSFDDPLLAVPATDQKLNVTYKNRYCAMCNDVRNDLISWAVSLNHNTLLNLNATYGNITNEYVLDNLIQRNNSWGVNHWDPDESRVVFHIVNVTYHKPVYLVPNVRYCRANVVSTCAPGYRRPSVQAKCMSYMAVLYLNGTAYRNAHCALCNRVSIKDSSCALGVTSRQPPSVSLPMLLDVNTSDGSQVGVRRRCSSNQTFDPIYKRCRDLTCSFAGFVARNGRCVRQ